MYYAFLPSLLNHARRQKGMSQAQLAKAVGVAQGTISKIEHGRYDGKRATLTAIEQVLDLEPGVLVGAACRDLVVFNVPYIASLNDALDDYRRRARGITIPIVTLHLPPSAMAENSVFALSMPDQSLEAAGIAKGSSIVFIEAADACKDGALVYADYHGVGVIAFWAWDAEKKIGALRPASLQYPLRLVCGSDLDSGIVKIIGQACLILTELAEHDNHDVKKQRIAIHR